MRYNNFKSFESHLAASAPHNLSRLYLVAAAEEFEQKKALNQIIFYLKDRFVTRFVEADEKQVREELSTHPLFGGEPVVLVENADKKFLDSFANDPPLSFGYFLIGTRAKPTHKNFEITGVVLDLTEEKPWDREKRLVEMLHEKALSLGKELSPDAAAWMVEHLESNGELLMNELEKLLCFCASKKNIERADAEEICTKNRTRTLWALAEELVWEQSYRLPQEGLRDSFHAFISQVRSQLSLGSKIAELQQCNIPYSEWGGYFPKLRPKVLEKKVHYVRRLGAEYFQKRLDHVFHLDLLSKSSSVSLEALADLLRLYFKDSK